MTVDIKKLEVQQVNSFYNYTYGLDITEVDLLKTAMNLLKSNIVNSVCFSDLKAIYLNSEGEIKHEWIQPNGRQWDEGWKINFTDGLPQNIKRELVLCLEMYFCEQRIQSAEEKQIPLHLRALLPPFVLESDSLTLPIHPYLSIYADGIMSFAFQLDTVWKELPEEDFINDIVNLFQCYFERIWVQGNLQRLDGEQLLPYSFDKELSIGGKVFYDRKTRKFIKEMQQTAKNKLDASLGQEGKRFELKGESWILHQIAGTEEQTDWEATIDLCRSIYAGALMSQIIGIDNKDRPVNALLWQGRPSISLMRFKDQPASKEQLFDKFSSSLARIMQRSPNLKDLSSLPKDLRLFDDYCFHGNRAILLWTWLKPGAAPENVWEDSNTRSYLLSNQVSAEHFEYHNMRIARACDIAANPNSDEQLIFAYKTLASAEAVIHKSSKVGEIVDAIKYLIDAVGTAELIAPGKENSRWHLDERRFNTEKNKARIDRWLAIIFGFVGAAGLADLVIKPFLLSMYPGAMDWSAGLTAFLSALALIGGLAAIIMFVNRDK